ncbi:DUF5047 domain-containing protein [Streptomyces sp. MS06]|uniref:DUF5047 domain-containing protein n=1 Tax=Streptomyces sp. MS06 TaxID=3385974 RepID=UPI0039A0FE0D
MSTEAQAIVLAGYTMSMRAESWLGDELLAADIPISGGGETRDRSDSVPERITLTVPRRDRSTDWDPRTVDHPLAAYGQRLRIDSGVELRGGHTEWINRGSFVITDSRTDGETVTVTADGLLSLIDEAKFVAPFQPSGTLVSTVRALVEPALTVTVDGTLADRAVPLGMQWDTDRLGALAEVLSAWPASARVTEDGYLLVEPLSDDGDPVLSLTDGVGGTVVEWRGGSSRAGAFNVVVAQGEDSDGTQIQGVAYDAVGTSPYRTGGPFNPLPVPYQFESPLMSTVAQCRAAASTKLAALRRQAYRKLDVTMVPHPGLVIGDLVSVTGAGLTDALCAVEAMSLPYSPGEMALTVRVL